MSEDSSNTVLDVSLVTSGNGIAASSDRIRLMICRHSVKVLVSIEQSPHGRYRRRSRVGGIPVEPLGRLAPRTGSATRRGKRPNTVADPPPALSRRAYRANTVPTLLP